MKCLCSPRYVNYSLKLFSFNCNCNCNCNCNGSAMSPILITVTKIDLFSLFDFSHLSHFKLISLMITLVNTIFVTSKLFSVSDIIFYTEFKYVLSFSLSRKVFKWHTVIIWGKRVLTYYINVFLHYLKSNCGWFPAVCRLWNISLEGPVVVSQHTEAPLALVPLFHVGNVVMKSLSVLVTDGANILREEV
jgi:hypothetical protein